MKKILYVIAGVIAIAAIAGGYFYPKFTTSVGAVSSTPGTNFNTATAAAQSLVVGTSTIYSVLNTDSADRMIEAFSAHVYTAVSTTSQVLGVACATSTSPSGVSQGSSANWIVNQNVSAFGTTTGDGAYIVSSSTPGITANVANSALATSTRIWNTGTYLVCELSANDGTALQSPLGVNFKGYLRFAYQRQ